VSVTCGNETWTLLEFGGLPKLTVAVGRIVVAFEREEHVFAFELGCLKVGGPDREVGIAGPNELAIITEDVW